MDEKRKERIARITFALNGFIFLLGALGLFDDGKAFYGALHLLAGLLNLSMLRTLKNQKLKLRLTLVILLMNIVVALSVAVDYIQQGKEYIQYVWFLTAILSTVALIIQIRRSKGN